MAEHKKILVFLILFLFATRSYGENIYCFWIPFTDKGANTYNLGSPQGFLSGKAIERRQRGGIAIDITDLPVTQYYIDEIKSTGLKVQYALKWINGVVAYSNDSNLINETKKFPFVKEVGLIALFDSEIKSTRNKFDVEKMTADSFSMSFDQLTLLNGNYLHDINLKGKNMTIAVIDAGFENANQLPALQHLWLNGQILGTRDFSTNAHNIFASHRHGTNVLSIIGGELENQLTGPAGEAYFHLLRSEVVGYEQPVEEYNWMAAAEYADSIGVDIINSSLGYSYFDYPFSSHIYDDMNGRTTIITKAASMASRKGILVVSSAGNEGLGAWYHVLAPADADSILAVAATDNAGMVTGFSSRGPSFDSRVKPDVAAMGESVVFQQSNGSIERGNGTSFAAPIITGLAACLWQGFPGYGNMQIRQAILNSASQFNNPDDELGYGLPDFKKAYEILKSIPENGINIDFYPNPVENYLMINIGSAHERKVDIKVYNFQSYLLIHEEITAGQFDYNYLLDVSSLRDGMYIMRVQTEGLSFSTKLFKLNSF